MDDLASPSGNGAAAVKTALTVGTRRPRAALPTMAARAMQAAMGWPLTLIIAALAAAAAVASGWAGSRPPDLQRGPRLMPYRFMMLLSAMVVLLMVVHALNLLGVTTGRQPAR